MKKLLTILVILISFASYGQLNDNNVFANRLRSGANFNLPCYADTTAANLDLGVDSCGAVIFTYSGNKVWKRSCIPSKAWEEIGAGGGGAGTVTQVNTGFGVTGGPITTTGTIVVDSFSMATRARVQKGIDSLGGLIGGSSFWQLTGNTIAGGRINFLGTTSNRSIYFRTNNTEYMVLDSNGRVGINTAAPLFPLHVTGSTTGYGSYNVTHAGVGSNPSIELTNTGRTAGYVLGVEPGTGDFYIGNVSSSAYSAVVRMSFTGNYFQSRFGKAFFGGSTVPTAVMHLAAGTASANTSPLKFTSGTNLTSPEAGAMEWNGTNLFITQTSGPTRKTLAYTTDITLQGALTGGSTLNTSNVIDANNNDFAIDNINDFNITANNTIINGNAGIVGNFDASGTGAFGGVVTSDRLSVYGNLSLINAGNKIKIATGSNASIGTATLSSGTVTVNTTAVSASSIIVVTYNTPSGTLASGLSAPVGSIVAGTSFVINSLTTGGVVNTLDNSQVNWWIIN